MSIIDLYFRANTIDLEEGSLAILQAVKQALEQVGLNIVPTDENDQPILVSPSVHDMESFKPVMAQLNPALEPLCEGMLIANSDLFTLAGNEVGEGDEAYREVAAVGCNLRLSFAECPLPTAALTGVITQWWNVGLTIEQPAPDWAPDAPVTKTKMRDINGVPVELLLKPPTVPQSSWA